MLPRQLTKLEGPFERVLEWTALTLSSFTLGLNVYLFSLVFLTSPLFCIRDQSPLRRILNTRVLHVSLIRYLVGIVCG